MVGFWFGQRPTVALHVQKMVAKFYSRLWVLRHLKWSRLPLDDIHLLYNSLVRPVLDFAVPAYHSLLTGEQSGILERLQARAFKIIYGWDVAYETVLKSMGAETLRARRQRLVDQFAKKVMAHKRFGEEWFSKKLVRRGRLRKSQIFNHERPQTELYKGNPHS